MSASVVRKVKLPTKMLLMCISLPLWTRYPIAHAVAALTRFRSAMSGNTAPSWMCREWAERWTKGIPQNRRADSSVTSRQLNCPGRALANTRLTALLTILSVQWPQTTTCIFAARKKKLQPAFRTLRSKLSPFKLVIRFQPGEQDSVSTPSDGGMRVPVRIKRVPTLRVFDIASSFSFPVMSAVLPERNEPMEGFGHTRLGCPLVLFCRWMDLD